MLNRTGITDNSPPHQCVLALRSLLPALIYLRTCSTLCLISLFPSHVLVCTFLLAYCQDVKEALLSQIQAMFFPILIYVFICICGAQFLWSSRSHNGKSILLCHSPLYRHSHNLPHKKRTFLINLNMLKT